MLSEVVWLADSSFVKSLLMNKILLESLSLSFHQKKKERNTKSKLITRQFNQQHKFIITNFFRNFIRSKKSVSNMEPWSLYVTCIYIQNFLQNFVRNDQNFSQKIKILELIMNITILFFLNHTYFKDDSCSFSLKIGMFNQLSVGLAICCTRNDFCTLYLIRLVRI